MIITSDIHIGLNKSDEKFYSVVVDLFTEIADVCVRKGIDKIAILGDIFENRRIISQKSLNVIQKIIKLCKNLKLILIRGNHDTYYFSSSHPNWLSVLRNFENVITVEDEPFFLENFCFVPWAYPVEDLNWNKILLGHFEIKSFMMNDGFECQKGILPETLEKFEHVYSGHFHSPSSKNNITYLGAPFQQNFGDCGSVRGYYILDKDLEFIEFTKAPKFHKIRTKNYEEEKHLITGNYIKLIFDEDYGINKNTQIIEEIESLKPLSLSIDTTRFYSSYQIENSETAQYNDTKEMFLDFLLKKENINLNEKILRKIVDKLWKEE